MYNSKIHHRKSLRLKDYNYSNNGMYFITICTKNRKCCLSEINDGKIVLKKFGIIVLNEIKRTEIIRKDIKINHYVIMPNHIHMIIENVGVARCATQRRNIETIKIENDNTKNNTAI